MQLIIKHIQLIRNIKEIHLQSPGLCILAVRLFNVKGARIHLHIPR